MKKLCISLMATCAMASLVVKAEDPAWDFNKGSSSETWTPLEISVVSPIEVPWSTDNVYGWRLGLLVANHSSIYGLDTGVMNIADDDVYGVQAGVFGNWNAGKVYGLQIGGLFNSVTGRSIDLQIAGILNDNADYAGGIQIALFNNDMDFDGLQFAAVNYCNGDMNGGAFSLMNWDEGATTGLSAGAINLAAKSNGVQLGAFNFVNGRAEGLQLGVINATDTLWGLQIGLFNINVKGAMAISPIVNWSFR